MKLLRQLFVATLSMSAGLAWAQAGADANFPNRPVRMIVGFTAGTGSDLLARNVIPELSKYLGQSVMVDNRAGAGGVIGTEAGARSPADGYTVTVASAGALLIVPAINPATPYRHGRDFVPIGGLARSGYMFVTANTPEAPKTFEALVQRVRAAPAPTLFASPGVGTATHLAGEIVLKQAGLKTEHISYKGSAQALSDIAAGQVLFGLDTVGATLPLIRAGKLRPLAVTSANRLTSLPEVPTLSEAGLPGFSLDGWWGLFAPIATPPEIVAKLSDNLVRALKDPEVRKRLAAQEVEPFPLSSREMSALMAKEEPMYVKMVQDANLAQK